MSEYVELMGLRRIALQQGDEKTAQELMEAAQELIAADAVTDADFLAAAYL